MMFFGMRGDEMGFGKMLGERGGMGWDGMRKSWEVRSELEGGNLVALFSLRSSLLFLCRGREMIFPQNSFAF